MVARLLQVTCSRMVSAKHFNSATRVLGCVSRSLSLSLSLSLVLKYGANMDRLPAHDGNQPVAPMPHGTARLLAARCTSPRIRQVQVVDTPDSGSTVAVAYYVCPSRAVLRTRDVDKVLRSIWTSSLVFLL